VSDLFGEKLHELHVEEIIMEIFNKELPFAFLAPSAISKETFYILYLSNTQKSVASIRAELEEKLCY